MLVFPRPYFAQSADAQQKSPATLLRENRYPLTVQDGTLADHHVSAQPPKSRACWLIQQRHHARRRGGQRFSGLTVPREDVASGATKASIGLVGAETRPIVIIHAARKVIAAPYAAVAYHATKFWGDDTDFDSKYALTVLQDLMALAEVIHTTHALVVTVPAG